MNTNSYQFFHIHPHNSQFNTQSICGHSFHISRQPDHGFFIPTIPVSICRTIADLHPAGFVSFRKIERGQSTGAQKRGGHFQNVSEKKNFKLILSKSFSRKKESSKNNQRFLSLDFQPPLGENLKTFILFSFEYFSYYFLNTF